MRAYTLRRYLNPVMLTVVLTLISAVSQPKPCRAASLKDLQKLEKEVSQTVNRSRGLAHAILKRLKEIDESCRDARGNPIPGQRKLAQEMMGRADALRTTFNTNAEQAEDLIDEFGKKYEGIRGRGSRENEIRASVGQLSAGLRKYINYVQKFFSRAERDFGLPIEPVGRVAAVAGVPTKATPGFRIKGEFAGAAGGSSYKRPHADLETDLSSTDLNLRVAGALIPSQRTQLPFHLRHQRKIEQREIGLTSMGGGVRHSLNESIGLGFDLDYSGYSDKADKTLSFGDFSLGARSSYSTQQLQLNVNLKHLSRSYGDNENANYSTLHFQPDLVLRAGSGSAAIGVKMFSKSNEVEVLDHKELSPFFRWQLSKGGSELNVRYQTITHPNIEDSPQDNNRLKASFHAKSSSATSRRMFGPGIAIYSHPHADQNDYIDYNFVFNGQSFGKKASLSSLRAVYRQYSDTLRYDFAQLTFRRSKRSVGSGFGWESNLAARYYTESSDKDDPLRFSNVHDPHTVDYYHRMGWTKAGSGGLREFTIGPIFGGKFYIDTERDDAFETDVDYVFQNPRNTVLGGIHLKVLVLAADALRIRTGFKWQAEFLYNADPTRYYSITDLEISGEYQISPQWYIDARGDFHSTRADINSDTDLDKSTITVQVRYLFDVVR